LHVHLYKHALASACLRNISNLAPRAWFSQIELIDRLRLAMTGANGVKPQVHLEE
jgi:hypothetical protein